MIRNELAESDGRQLAAARTEHDDGPARCDTFDRACEALAADRLGDQRERPLGQIDRFDNLPGSEAAEIVGVPGRGDCRHRGALLAGDLDLKTADRSACTGDQDLLAGEVAAMA